MFKKEERERNAKIQHWKVIAFYLVVYDIIAVNFSYFLGLWLRFDLQYSNIPREYLSAFLKFAACLYRCGSYLSFISCVYTTVCGGLPALMR